ncbi:MAG: BatA domain-containing protein [Planctomycetaceae bacterium]|nr:BatA domain-containing protein [Planctomycetaceae bacterium]
MFSFFAHPLMLGWLAVAAAPLLIHLLSRRKYREVTFAAMSFIVAALKKNSRRIQLEQWILLALRTLLVILVVTALAEPFLESAGLQSTSGEHIHKVIVIDGSFSMAFKPTDKSRFDRAKELADRIVDESLQGDSFTLVLMTTPPRAIVATPSFEARSVRSEIENLRLPHAGGDLPGTVALVERLIDTAERENTRPTHHQVFFLTDLGRTSWSVDTAGPSGQEFLARSKKLAERAALQVIDLGQDDAENTAVTRFTLVDPYVTTARDVTFEAELRNFGRQRRDQLLVELFVDGRRVAEEHVDLEAGGQATVSFPFRFDTPGSHLAELRLASDLLDVDNHRWHAVEARESLRVLAINGKPSGGELRGATDYLTVALQPRSDQVDRPLVRVDVAAESALVEHDLTTYDSIFLCNVAQFTQQEASVLSAYQRHGGGVVCFLGDQVNADSYNRWLATGDENRAPVLPAMLGDLAPSGQYLFDPLEYRHPIVAPFRDQEQAGLLTTPTQRYIKLKLPEETEAKIALAFTGGDPAIVESPAGRGRTVLVATSADLSWTTMPVLPSYLPIVQELLAWSVQGHTGERNVLVGASFGRQSRELAGQSAVSVKSPLGESTSIRITPGVEPSWIFNDTATSGPYAATVGNEAESYAVNIDTVESDLARVDAAELRDQVWSGVRHSLRTDWQNLSEGEDESIARRNALHQWLLVVALVVMLTETTLASWFGRRSR